MKNEGVKNEKAEIEDESVDIFVCAIVVNDIEYVTLGLLWLIFLLYSLQYK